MAAIKLRSGGENSAAPSYHICYGASSRWQKHKQIEKFLLNCKVKAVLMHTYESSIVSVGLTASFPPEYGGL